MKKIYLLPLLFFALFSCKKNEQTALNKKLIIDSNITVSELRIPLSLQNNTGTKTYSFLGWGYDVTGLFADSAAVRAQSINIEAFVADFPGRFDRGEAATGLTRSENYDNAQEISLRTSNALPETSGLNLFGGEVTAYFPDDPFSLRYMYSAYLIYIQHVRLVVNAPPSLLKPYLTSQFKQDVATLSAEALVAKYGTHVLSGVSLGARFRALYQAQGSAVDANREGFAYAMNKAFGIWANKIDKTDSTLLAKVSAPRITYRLTGGDRLKIKSNTVNGMTKTNIIDWVNSSAKANDGFVGTGESPLIALADLIDDPLKKSAVAQYVQSYLNAAQVKAH